MIIKIGESLKYDSTEIKSIDNIDKLEDLDWDNPKGEFKKLKEKIKSSLLTAQKSITYLDEYPAYDCAYCGTRLDVGGRKEVEHIANKAKYKAFSYYNTNLVYACSHCNSTNKKGQKNIVTNWVDSTTYDFTKKTFSKQIMDIYCQLEFNIVHPKIDDPDDHYTWKDAEKTILIGFKTPKGDESIKMFKLDSPEMTLQRIKDVMEEKDFIKDPEIYKDTLKYTRVY